jgi:hypothetical protein
MAVKSILVFQNVLCSKLIMLILQGYRMSLMYRLTCNTVPDLKSSFKGPTTCVGLYGHHHVLTILCRGICRAHYISFNTVLW